MTKKKKNQVSPIKSAQINIIPLRISKQPTAEHGRRQYGVADAVTHNHIDLSTIYIKNYFLLPYFIETFFAFTIQYNDIIIISNCNII